MRKRVLVIAGGEWQVPLIRRIGEMGFEVYNANLYPDSPGFAYADGSFVANVLDREANLRYAKEIRPDAVMTDESDVSVPTVAFLADRLGLPGIGEDKAALFTDKHLMREFCRTHGFASPEFRLCSTLEEAEAFLAEHRRMILKPIDNQASLGVFLIEDPEELREKFDRTMSFSRRARTVLAEQYIEGREFTVDSIVVKGKCTSLATSLKYQYPHNPNVTQTLYFTNESAEYDLDLLRRNNERLVEAMGLPFGITHAEYKFMDGRFYLIEIAARGGGTRISSHLVPLMSGVDNYRVLIEQSLGSEEDYDVAPRREYRQRKAVLEFLSFPEGRVESIGGLEEAAKLPGVVELRLNFQVGDTLRNASDDRTRSGFFIAWAESAEALDALRDRVKGTLRIAISKE